jgi:hypothetical protein
MSRDLTFGMTSLKGALIALCLTTAACGGGSGGSKLPSFHDVTEASAAIQSAARAVVRIQAGRLFGTGAFLSSDGLLLTNNHVLGVDVCPIEGCVVALAFLHQVGVPPSEPVTVRATPVAVDVGLDMAMLKVVNADGSPRATPDFLQVTARESAELVGTEVTIVGHPHAELKLWTAGTVIDAFGDWFSTSAYVLPGDSGSPVLNDAGELVGLLHRGPDEVDLLTDRGANVFGIASASGPLQRAFAAPLPDVMISGSAPTTAEAFVAHDAVYQNWPILMIPIGGTWVEALTPLAAACDAALARTDIASPDDLVDALAPCRDAQRWTECRYDADFPPYALVCPDDVSAWNARYQAMNLRAVALNGISDLASVSFAVAALSPDTATGRANGARSLLAALNAANQGLDFDVANYLAAFAVPAYGDTDVVDWLRDYHQRPAYQYFARSIASAFLWARSNGMATDAETLNVLKDLDRDPDVDIDAKLYIEDVRYRWGK